MRIPGVSALANYFRSNKPAADGEGGQTLVEYGLIIAFMSIGLIGALGLFQGGLSGKMQEIIDAVIAVIS